VSVEQQNRICRARFVEKRAAGIRDGKLQNGPQGRTRREGTSAGLNLSVEFMGSVIGLPYDRPFVLISSGGVRKSAKRH